MTYPLAVTLHTTLGLGWTILGALVLIALAAWSYRWTRPPLPRWGKVTLAALRALALVAVWLLAVGFTVRWVNEVPERPRVALLLDASQSMAFEDSHHRPDTLRRILEHPVWEYVDSAQALERYTFAADLRNGSNGMPTLDGPVTDLEAALNAFSSRPEGPPDAVVLISDGAFNRGGAYTSAARRLGSPVHAVAVGDSLPRRDLVISSLVAPDLGYAGEAFPLDITVRGTGLDGSTAKLRVIGNDGQVLETRDIAIAGDWTEETVTVDLTPQHAGMNSWTVEVLPVDGEADTGNNARRAAIRAADRRRTVIVFAPAPLPDAGAVARALEEDPDTDARVVIGAGRLARTTRGAWEDAAPANADAAFLFLDGPWSDAARSAATALLNSDLPLFISTGDDDLDPQLLETAATRLGGPEEWMDPAEALLRPVVPHPIYSEGGGFFPDGPVPPVLRGPYRPNEGRTLAVVSHNEDDVPTLVRTGLQPRTLALFASGLARWDRVRRPADPGGESFRALLDRTLRWLTSGGEEDRITVHPEQELFSSGETARLLASVADPGLNPVEDARVTAAITRARPSSDRADDPEGDDDSDRARPGSDRADEPEGDDDSNRARPGSDRADDPEGVDDSNRARPGSDRTDEPEGDDDSDRARPGSDRADERRTVEFQSIGGGRYAASTLPWGEGRYVAEVTVETDQETVTRETEFVVDAFDLESAERRMRPDRLRAVADASGGQVIWSPAELDTLRSLLPRATDWVERRGSWRPFGLWLTLLLVVALLAAEWLARTRTGMA